MKQNPTVNEIAFQRLTDQYLRSEIAAMCGLVKQGVYRWTEVPLKYVRTISERTGIAESNILPNPYIQGHVARKAKPPPPARGRPRKEKQ